MSLKSASINSDLKMLSELILLLIISKPPVAVLSKKGRVALKVKLVQY